MEEEAVDPGPWFDRVERSGDGTTDSSELYVVKPKKKTCALCELWFSTDNLTGMTSLKGVLTRKASFGDEDAARRLKDPRTTASRLYSGVPLCSFCAQLARPDPDVPLVGSDFSNRPFANDPGRVVAAVRLARIASSAARVALATRAHPPPSAAKHRAIPAETFAWTSPPSGLCAARSASAAGRRSSARGAWRAATGRASRSRGHSHSARSAAATPRTHAS